MNIDRSNYELWLIDWLDGKLTHFELEQLHRFLSENPDIKEESEELAIVRLNPSSKSFPYKNRLKKTTAALSLMQLEYLSIGYLENDLSPDQKIELMESIENNPEQRKLFDLIKRTRLLPVALPYRNKNKLIRRTVFQNVFKLSVIGLSAAAILTIVLFTYISKPKNLQIKSDNIAESNIIDSLSQNPAKKIVSHEINPVVKKLTSENIGKNLSPISQKPSVSKELTSNISSSNNDSTKRYTDRPVILINKIPVSSKIVLKEESIRDALITLNYKPDVLESEDGRSRFGKFIAKTFREKVLKENTTVDSPLKAYEVAEAGVSGLNKLFGWDMVLNEKKNTNGEPKSICFSSKILKFNAPVKKSKSLP